MLVCSFEEKFNVMVFMHSEALWSWSPKTDCNACNYDTVILRLLLLVNLPKKVFRIKFHVTGSEPSYFFFFFSEKFKLKQTVDHF